MILVATAAFVTGEGEASAAPTSLQNAYSFLNQMMDRYQTGSTPRLVQSFTGGILGAQDFTDSETYDDALVVEAYVAEGGPTGLGRAEAIANALLLVQMHDPAHDGRIRVAYAPSGLVTYNKRGKERVQVRIRDKTSDVGNMAWVGMALVDLYGATGGAQYLGGAEDIADWVVSHCYDTRGSGGFTGGDSANGKRITWKSTEHNIDLYGLFTMLATATGNAKWTVDASWAKRFVTAMWNSTSGSFWVGTTGNGVTPNTSEQPEDVNSWSYLALQNPLYERSVSWDVENLSVSSGGFNGVSFCLGDKTGVWFEGTAHLADALEVRNSPGDAAVASQYLTDIEYAQTSGPNTDGLGIIAASKNGLSDCDGDSYDASLHIGATAWYILASLHIDPFTL